MSQAGAVAVAVLLFCLAFGSAASAESTKGETSKERTSMYLEKCVLCPFLAFACRPLERLLHKIAPLFLQTLTLSVPLLASGT